MKRRENHSCSITRIPQLLHFYICWEGQFLAAGASISPSIACAFFALFVLLPFWVIEERKRFRTKSEKVLHRFSFV